MAAPIEGLLPAKALLHPAFDPLRPWLSHLGERPGFIELNALAVDAVAGPATSNGQPIVFCEPPAVVSGHYEQKIFFTGRVDTRPDNQHDLFNALAWLAFPRTKAAINARHVERIAVEGSVRGPLRDLLTLADEGGVIVACSDRSVKEIETLIRGFRWQELFWERRAQVLEETRFVLMGHNAYEKALAPYPGITCKALFVATPRELLGGPCDTLVRCLDGRAAAWIQSLPDSAAPRKMAPLPVFGYPGWLAQSADAEFYRDRRWFRVAPLSRNSADKLEPRT